MKGIANGIADSLDVAFTYEPIQKSFLHPYQAVKVLCEGEEIGYFGKVAYDIQDKLSMRASAYVMELDLEILSKWYDKKRTFITLPKFAEEKRDLAFVMDKAITCASSNASSFGTNVMENAILFFPSGIWPPSYISNSLISFTYLFSFGLLLIFFRIFCKIIKKILSI